MLEKLLPLIKPCSGATVEGGMKPKLGGIFEVAVSLVRGFKMQSDLMSCEVNEKEEGAGQSHASWCPVPHIHIQIPVVLKAVSPAGETETGPADSLLLSPRLCPPALPQDAHAASGTFLRRGKEQLEIPALLGLTPAGKRARNEMSK